jgi:hypothetical protein
MTLYAAMATADSKDGLVDATSGRLEVQGDDRQIFCLPLKDDGIYDNAPIIGSTFLFLDPNLGCHCERRRADFRNELRKAFISPRVVIYGAGRPLQWICRNKAVLHANKPVIQAGDSHLKIV